jgi:hypothetical protein
VPHKAAIGHGDHTWNAHGHSSRGYEHVAAFLKHVTIELDDNMGRQAQYRTDSQCEPISISWFHYYQENPERYKLHQANAFAHNGNSYFEIRVSTMEYYHENPQRDKMCPRTVIVCDNYIWNENENLCDLIEPAILGPDDIIMRRQTRHTPELYPIPRSVSPFQSDVENPERDKLYPEDTTAYIIVDRLCRSKQPSR